MRLSIGGADVTQLAASISTSGSEKECARTLTVDIVQSPTDPNIPTIAVSEGMAVYFDGDGQSFTGVVLGISKSTASNSITVTAKDLGIYVKRNKVVFKVKNMTAEAAAAALCAAHGITAGSMAATGYEFSRYYLNVALADAILTGYALAAAVNGKAYMLRMDGAALSVIEKGATIADVISAGSNLIEASYSENADSVVNQVEIYDQKGNLKQTVTGDISTGSIGVMKEIIIEQSSREESIAAANALMKDNAVKRSGTVKNIGSPACVSGNAVLIYESFTGLYGKFFISSDTHTWKNGVYTNKLTIAWEATMDAKAAGEELKKSSGPSSTGKWAYKFPPGSAVPMAE